MFQCLCNKQITRHENQIARNENGVTYCNSALGKYSCHLVGRRRKGRVFCVHVIQLSCVQYYSCVLPYTVVH